MRQNVSPSFSTGNPSELTSGLPKRFEGIPKEPSSRVLFKRASEAARGKP
jgi:hypothetical protein